MMRRLVLTIVMLMNCFFVTLLTGCGEKDGNALSNADVDMNDYVYVSQHKELVAKMGTHITDINMVDDKLFYTVKHNNEKQASIETAYCLDIKSEEAEPDEIWNLTSKAEKEGYSASTIKRVFTEDGGSISVVENYPTLDNDADISQENESHSDSFFYLKKADKDNQEIFSVDITSYMNMGGYTCFIQYAVVSKDGNIFLSDGNNFVWVFSDDGKYITDIKLDVDWTNGIYIQSFGLTNDGKATYLKKDVDGYSICIYNDRKKDFSDSFQNLPEYCINTPLCPGVNQGILVSGTDALYEYDFSKQKSEKLTQWIDVDIQNDFVSNTFSLSDGDIVVFCKDPANVNLNDFVLLKKTLASEVKLKKTILISSLGLSQILQEAIVDFNKSSEEYRIVSKDYAAGVDLNSQTLYADYEAAKEKLQIDIATGQGADLFLANTIDLEMLVKKGIIEDLNPYLEQSKIINRSELIEPVLKAHERDGILCAIPYGFNVQTLMGRVSELGESTHWTIDEAIDYANKYPDCNLYAGLYNTLLLSDIIGSDISSYVNWDTGECYFDSEHFKKLLTYSGKYPGYDEYEYGIQIIEVGTHKSLLNWSSIGDAYQLSLYKQYFKEPATVIGFPCKEPGGVKINGVGALCINSNSQNKEGAWAFIESIFTKDFDIDTTEFRWLFPTKKSLFDEVMQEAMTPSYVLDEEGAISLDENGDPIQSPKYTDSWNDVLIELNAITQEDVDELWEIINRSDGLWYANTDLMNIIEEEAASYYAGQKSVDEVADIIQSRVKLYINENR